MSTKIFLRSASYIREVKVSYFRKQRSEGFVVGSDLMINIHHERLMILWCILPFYFFYYCGKFFIWIYNSLLIVLIRTYNVIRGTLYNVDYGLFPAFKSDYKYISIISIAYIQYIFYILGIHSTQ